MATFSNAITTAAQLHQAETATYLTDAVIGIAFIVLFLIVANLIPKESGSYDSSPAKRRKCFYLFGILSLFVSLGVNYYMWMRHITKVQFVNEYTIHMIVSAFICLVIFGVVSYLICRTRNPHTKLWDVFNK